MSPINHLYPKCSFCGESPPAGLYDGFRLTGKFICSGCEEQMMAAEIGSEQYRKYLSDIKKILCKMESKTEYKAQR